MQGMKGDKTRSSYVLAVAILVALGLLPFAPLLAAVAEHMLLGTHRVEEFCRRMGVHDDFAALYRACGIVPDPPAGAGLK